MTSQPTTAERTANLRADQSVLIATAAGAILSVIYVLLSSGGSIRRAPTSTAGLLELWLWGAAPVVLILGAYLMVATAEGRDGERHQRGALAVLVGAAVIVTLPSLAFAFSPVYGVALILLAVRTRGVLAAAVGVLALTAAFGITTLTSAGAALGVVMVAIASGIAARRVRQVAVDEPG
ncbi:hypothetical protein ACX80O_09805 [Arthrobacter sp. Hz1]